MKRPSQTWRERDLEWNRSALCILLLNRLVRRFGAFEESTFGVSSRTSDLGERTLLAAALERRGGLEGEYTVQSDSIPDQVPSMFVT
ncbi:hypothetical protein ACC771_15840, partial [Rhizobium ruizarguesonis]